jgi:hypothetical protein
LPTTPNTRPDCQLQLITSEHAFELLVLTTFNLQMMRRTEIVFALGFSFQSMRRVREVDEKAG